MLNKHEVPESIDRKMQGMTSCSYLPEMLSNQEEFFRIILETTASVVLILQGEAGQLVYINPFARQLLGYQISELQNNNLIEMLVPAKHRAEVTRHYLAVLAGQKPLPFYETAILTKNGKTCYIRWTSSLLPGKQSVRQIVLIGHDITASVIARQQLKASREKYFRLFNNSPDVIYTLNHQGLVTNINKTALELMGYQKHEIIGQHYKNFLHPADQELAEKNFFEISQPGSRHHYTLRLKHRDGNYLYFEIKTFSHFDQTGDFVFIEGVARDITKQVRARKKLLEQHQQLKEMHAALQKAMITDRLTDLGNREHYEQQLLETESKEPWPCGILLLDVCGLSLINDSLGYEQGNLLLKKVAAVLKRYESEQISCYRIDGDGFAVLFKNLPEENIKQQVNTLLQDLANVTIDVANTRVLFSYGLAISNQECSLQDLHWQADRDLNQGKQNERNQAQMSIISSLQAALEERDYMTEAHAERLEQLADIFAVALDLTPQDRAHLRAFMLMHDIGKVGIPDRILLKPGRLTAQEMKIMQRHSSIGYRIAMASPEMAPIAKYILHHHERWDGTGYPAGLKGDDIPLLCRILAIIDAFDAMTNDRPYRRAMPEEKAIKELQRCAGSQFDPYLVQLFVEHVLPRQKTSHS